VIGDPPRVLSRRKHIRRTLTREQDSDSQVLGVISQEKKHPSKRTQTKKRDASQENFEVSQVMAPLRLFQRGTST